MAFPAEAEGLMEALGYSGKAVVRRRKKTFIMHAWPLAQRLTEWLIKALAFDGGAIESARKTRESGGGSGEACREAGVRGGLHGV